MMKIFLMDGEFTDLANDIMILISFALGISGIVYAAIAWS
jgi:hypothetical protein